MPLNTSVVKSFDTYCTAVVNGESFGPFDTWTPPERSGGTEEYWPGGASNSVRTRGRAETGTGTLTVAIRDSGELSRYRRLWRVSGIAPMSVTAITVNADGDPVDSATWEGLLEDVTLPEADASSTDNQSVELTFASNGEVA